jgi:hypothetical protein
MIVQVIGLTCLTFNETFVFFNYPLYRPNVAHPLMVMLVYFI